ncbi:MAG: hypothetical protein NZ700_04925 [Gemmataceae bacterium]|nr:hypothetical protein [Gemmataceae bacterium]MDW8267445.1 hypothetical protein [Gemmataceae bacterium]
MKSSPFAANDFPSANGGFVAAWVRFWFQPIDPIGLHVVRIGSGFLFLLWLLPLAGDLNGLFGLGGWFDRQAYAEAARLADNPMGQTSPVALLTWSLIYLVGDSPFWLAVLYWTTIVVVVMLTLGVATRLTAVLTWVTVTSFTSANPAIAFDADIFLNVFAWYVMVGYLLFGLRGREPTWRQWLLGPTDAWLLGRSEEGRRPSVAANLALRLLQVHFAIIVVTTGLHKLQFGDWWSGTALWYAVVPPFQATVADAVQLRDRRESVLMILSLSAYVILAWQLTFPWFAWRRRWRPLLLLGGVVGLLGTVFVFRYPIFGPALVIGGASYATPEEWNTWLAASARRLGLRHWADRLAALADGSAQAAAHRPSVALGPRP